MRRITIHRSIRCAGTYNNSYKQRIYPTVDIMRKMLFAMLAVGLMLATGFSGCVGEKKETPKGIETPKENQTVDFATIMKQAPESDSTPTMGHWRFEYTMGFAFQYGIAAEGVPPPTGDVGHILHDIKLPEGVAAIEALVDWESEFMDIDMYLLKGGKDTGICKPNYMINDPFVIAQGDQGTTWEYFNAQINKTKKFSVPGDYAIDVEKFNNWDPETSNTNSTPFTLDIWIYTEVPAQWHPHQELGQ